MTTRGPSSARDRVAQALAADDAEERRSAVVAVTDLDLRDTVPLLLAALGDADWRVRKEAARVASTHVPVRASLLPALLEALETEGSVGLHNSAVEALVGIGTAAVPVLLARLPSLTASARRFAIEALGDIADPAAIPALLAASRAPDVNLRAAAIEALGRVGGAEAGEALASLVHEEGDPFLRLAALESGARAGAVLPLSLLVALAEERILRPSALLALGRTGDRGAIGPLARALRDHARSSATAAVVALAELVERSGLVDEARAGLVGLGGAELGLLDDLLRAGSLPERQAAVVLLGLCDQAEATMLLARAAGDDDLAGLVDTALRRRGQAGAQALLAASREASPRALPVLLPALADLARGSDAEPFVVERLVALLVDGDEAVAAAAAECLGALDAKSAASVLATSLRAGSPRVGRAAAQALASIGGRHAAIVREAIRSFEIDGRSGALVAQLLGTVGDPSDVALLRAALGAADVALRRAAVESLWRLGGEHAGAAVVLALADESEDVQAAAATALGRTGGPRAMESLLAALGGSPHVAAAAARALGELGRVEACVPVAALVSSSHGGVAVAALDALRRLAAVHGLPAVLGGQTLDAALAHADPEVAKHALAIAAQGPRGAASARLAGALDHVAWDVRRQAAELLGQIPDAAARGALARRRDVETDALVRSAIEEALARR